MKEKNVKQMVTNEQLHIKKHETVCFISVYPRFNICESNSLILEFSNHCHDFFESINFFCFILDS
jgi:hypothetical protein